MNLPGELQDVVAVLPAAAWDVDARLSLVLSPDGNSGATRVEPVADGELEAVALGGRPEVLGRTWRLVMTDLEGYDVRALATGLPDNASPEEIVRAAKESDPGFVSLLLLPGPS